MDEIEDIIDFNLFSDDLNIINKKKISVSDFILTDLENYNFLDENTPDKYGLTPLHYAANNGNIEAVENLLSNGNVNVNAITNTGLTPLHYAVANNHIQIVHLLLLYNAQVNIMSNTGLTPLHYAAANNYVEVMNLLRNFSF